MDSYLSLTKLTIKPITIKIIISFNNTIILSMDVNTQVKIPTYKAIYSFRTQMFEENIYFMDSN